MKLFLVKWDDCSVALVGAADDTELIDILDQEGNPAIASWEEYDGPLWLTAGRMEESLPEGDVVVEELRWPQWKISDTDEGHAFATEVMGRLSPAVADLLETSPPGDGKPIPRDQFDEALDLDREIPLENQLSCWIEPLTEEERVSALSVPNKPPTLILIPGGLDEVED